MCVFSALRLGCRRCPGCSSHSRAGLGFRPTRNAVTMRFRIRIRAATVVVAGSVDYVVLGQVEDHARSITPQTRRLAHSSWSLSGWMCRNTHPCARARALASPTTTCHQEALQVIQPVNRCRSTNRCPVAIVEGGDELVTAELVETTIANRARPSAAGSRRRAGGRPCWTAAKAGNPRLYPIRCLPGRGQRRRPTATCH